MLRIPATLLSLLLLHFELGTVSAKPGRRPKYTVDENNNIINNYNDLYTLNLTVAGTVFNVMLDTGSTDAWVAPTDTDVLSGNFTDTGAVAAIFYGDGSNFVNGTVGIAEVEVAGQKIADQAFINVLNSVGEEFDQEHGVIGLIGLGFDGPSGDIPAALTKAGYNGSEVGKSVLTNIFDQNPTFGRFFAFSLSRVGDVADSADASLTISGYDDRYTAVQDAPLLLQHPPNSGMWSVQTDDVAINGVTIPWISSSATSPKAPKTVLLDTGTSNILVSQELRDAIYSAVPGAILAANSSIPNPNFNQDNDVWVIPCDTPVNLTVKFAGLDYPIHPLDVTDVSFLVGPDGNNYTVCINSVTNGGSVLGENLDALYGDSMLRNVYTVFSFGNETTPPHVQLLSDTQTDEAAQDFALVRSEILASSPLELSPQDIINLFDGPSSNSSDVPSSTSSSIGTTTPTPIQTSATASSPTETASDPPSDDNSADLSKVTSGKPAVNLADSDSTTSNSDSAAAKWGPIIVGLLGANLLVLLVLTFLGVMNYIRGGRTTGASRAVNASYVPVKLKDEGVPRRSSFERYND
ncbi:aspartic peptidase domain-containing protein [Roridomyces roridus]|uniref:Aspartic peptidase domain-containing protein n=1 Tax=Roridomyces roridus TaxID=1738132 RepID=A0AAD7FY23_9AGAR|nr:aspartic peptidase domain-containing protein [Roridomyces roridus]